MVFLSALLLLLLFFVWAEYAMYAEKAKERKQAARRRVGHCANCNYDLCGNESGICPECGSRVSGAKKKGPSSP